jgi:hypothetical protein
MTTEPAFTSASGDPYAEDDRTVGLDGPRPLDPFDEKPWDSWPSNDLDFPRAVAPESSLLEDVGKLVRAITQLVTSIPAANQAFPAYATAPASGPYTTANLPPGVTARAFNEAVRKKRVPLAIIGGRNMVRAADWDAYVSTLVRHQGAPAADTSDDELLASNGGRRRARARR